MTLPNLVLAVDPGKKTGLSLWSPHWSDDRPPEVTELSWPEFPTYVETTVHAYASQGSSMAIVCESFTITVQTAKHTQAPWSLEGIGVCRYVALKYDCEFVLQAPSSAKTFSSDDRLRQLGWWATGRGHGNDATRHLLLYCATRGWWSDRIAL